MRHNDIESRPPLPGWQPPVGFQPAALASAQAARLIVPRLPTQAALRTDNVTEEAD